MKKNVETAILEYCKKNDENIVLVISTKGKFKTVFDKNGQTKTRENKTNIFDYIMNVLRFAPGLRDIFINEINIGEFKLKELPHEKD